MDHSPFISFTQLTIIMATIDLRKESAYPQDMLGHYYGHHMTCGNTSMTFMHLSMISDLNAYFSSMTFDYDTYCHNCWSKDLQPAPMFKPKRCFVAHITIYKDTMMSPDINMYPTNEWAPNYTPKYFEVHHTPTYGVCYIHELRDYNGQLALEQMVALCKEYFAHANDI